MSETFRISMPVLRANSGPSIGRYMRDNKGGNQNLDFQIVCVLNKIQVADKQLTKKVCVRKKF